jgi:MbtH protein
MGNPFDDETGEFRVLVNEEGQYSLWPIAFPVPAGWTATGPTGARQICLDWIDATWTDMTPKSVVKP